MTVFGVPILAYCSRLIECIRLGKCAVFQCGYVQVAPRGPPLSLVPIVTTNASIMVLRLLSNYSLFVFSTAFLVVLPSQAAALCIEPCCNDFWKYGR